MRADDERGDPGDGPVVVNQTVDRLAAYSWRILVIAAVVAGILWMVGQIWVAFLPVMVALFLVRVLAEPNAWLRRRRLPPSLAASVSLIGFLVLLGGLGTGIAVAVSHEFEGLGPTVSRAVDDLERWLVEDSPFDVSPEDLDQFRKEAGERLGDTLRASGGRLAEGATVAAEVVLGLVLGLIVTFFALKDGDEFLQWARRRFPDHHHELIGRLAARSWRTLGGFLRGAALLGFVEGIAIGVTLALVGAELAIPMALITFLAAFLPVVGAIVAGVLAVLVALATAGGAAAVIVAVVALVVQQLDNDVLAPVVYGRALELHPVVVLLAILAGGSAFGLVGSFLAVPVVAVAVNAAAEAQAYRERNAPDRSEV